MKFEIDDPDGADLDAMKKTKSNVESYTQGMLTFRAAESKVR